jgi:hypothetical protein
MKNKLKNRLATIYMDLIIRMYVVKKMLIANKEHISLGIK